MAEESLANEQSPSRLFRLYVNLKKVNVYVEADEDSLDTQVNQILATRLFLVLMCISMFALAVYVLGSQRTYTVEVNNITQVEYERLQSKYPNTISCPCSQVSMSLGSFININVTFHQVCLMKFSRSEEF